MENPNISSAPNPAQSAEVDFEAIAKVLCPDAFAIPDNGSSFIVETGLFSTTEILRHLRENKEALAKFLGDCTGIPGYCTLQQSNKLCDDYKQAAVNINESRLNTEANLAAVTRERDEALTHLKNIQRLADEVKEWEKIKHDCPDGGCECENILDESLSNFWAAINKAWLPATHHAKK